MSTSFRRKGFTVVVVVMFMSRSKITKQTFRWHREDIVAAFFLGEQERQWYKQQQLTIYGTEMLSHLPKHPLRRKKLPMNVD